MKIIAFEGIDASGKETQAINLYNHLSAKNKRVAYTSIPRYNTVIGKEILRRLKGESKLSKEALHLLFEVDRLDFMNEIEELEKEGYDYLILDRFTLSNLAFAEANGVDIEMIKEVQKHLIKPDITILLMIPIEESLNRRKQRNDLFEENLELLTRAKNNYWKLATKDSSILIINAENKSISETFEEIIYRLHRKEVLF